MTRIRVRYASDSGESLEIDEALIALCNYIFAKKMRGDFLFRVDDIDKRYIDGASASANDQCSDLVWLGLTPDESPFNPNPKYAPYRQSERAEIYQRYIDVLISIGAAYESDVAREDKEPRRDGRKSINLSMKIEGDIAFVDLVQGKVSLRKLNHSDWLIMHSDGRPSTEFAAIIDDHLMGITHIIASERQLPNASRRLAINKHLNWTSPEFAHIELSKQPPGKRDSSPATKLSISDLRKKGYLPEAVTAYLFTIGLQGEAKREIETIQDQINSFDFQHAALSHPVFDLKKLGQISARFIKRTSDAEYLELVRPFIQSVIGKDSDDDYMLRLALLFKGQVQCGEEIIDLVAPLIAPNREFGPSEMQFLDLSSSKRVLAILTEEIGKAEILDFPIISTILARTQTLSATSGKDFYLPIRLALTGVTHGAEIAEIINFLGKEEVVKRLLPR